MSVLEPDEINIVYFMSRYHPDVTSLTLGSHFVCFQGSIGLPGILGQKVRII